MNRREMLRGTGVVAGALAVKAVGQNSSGAAQSARKCKIVVTGGHPGDPEYGCGGTIARLTAMGHEVVLLYMNDGAWEQTSAAVRIAEAKRACEILKARPGYANQINGHAIVDNRTTRRSRASSKRRIRTLCSPIGSSITIPITAPLRT